MEEQIDLGAGYTPDPAEDVVVVGTGASQLPVVRLREGGRYAHGKPAPELWVLYRCPECGTSATLDAYVGVPSCKGGGKDKEQFGVLLASHSQEFMVAVELAPEGP